MTHPAETFRALHVPGDPLVMPNIWDRGSALMMQNMGAKALATSSAALAFTLGEPDGGTVSREDHLTHAQEILSVAKVPVQGDFENGFGDDPDTCAETVRLAAEVGLAGICIEDTMFPSGAPYDRTLAVERIRAAVAAARAVPDDFVLTARADGIMTGHYDTDEAIRRLQAFRAVGADCLYAPLPPDMGSLRRIIEESGGPVNVLVAGPYSRYSREDFAQLGAARLSIGSALARVTHKAILDAGQAMLGEGVFEILGRGAGSDIVDPLLSKD